MNKLLKLSENHYVVVDDSEIKDVRPYKGRFHLEKRSIINKFPTYLTDLSECKIITHSTQPLDERNGKLDFIVQGILELSLSEVEEAIYGYNVEQLACDYAGNRNLGYGHGYPSTEADLLEKGYISGFNAHKELTKDKLFTVEDMRKAIIQTRKGMLYNKKYEDEYIESLLPKTEWNIEFDEQYKIKLI